MDKIELKIVKDEKGNNAFIEKLSIEASKSFTTFIQSLTKIAEASGKKDITRISLTRGSACVALEGGRDDIEEIGREIDLVLMFKSDRKEFVEPLRKIQDVFLQNGLIYDCILKVDETEITLLKQFKQKRKFRVVSSKKPLIQNNIIFFEGELKNSGGDNPNCHITLSDGSRETIQCTAAEAKRLSSLLYEHVRISAWEILKKDEKPKYIFCDSYDNPELFEDFKLFFEEISKMSGTAPLKMVHRKLKSFLDKKDFYTVNKFFQLLNHKGVDIGILRTALIITKTFREEKELKTLFEILIDSLRNRVGKSFV